MSLATRLYRGEISYDFMTRRKRWYAISAVLILVSLLSIIIRGFSFGIDFKGGAEFDFPARSHTVAEARDALQGTGINVEVVQQVSGSTPSIRLQTKPLDETQVQTVLTRLQDRFDLKTADINTTTVGSSWGSSVTTKAVQGLVVFLVAVILYISFRFEPKMAIAAIIALLHDLFITAGIYSLVGFEVTPATIIALLTILGFSLYDTVVVFDKVRENTAGLEVAAKKTYTQATNDAVNQTLMRSINTSLIALLPVASLLFIGAGLLGAGTLEDLALAQLVGLAAGAYSSIFIASPLLVDLKEREPRMKALAAKVARSQAAVSAREVRSGRTSGPAPQQVSSSMGDAATAEAGAGSTTVIDAELDPPGDEDEVQAPTAASDTGRRVAGMSKPGRPPAKRGKPGRPSGKKRR
jgi:preprotein translocase subunit SecF